MNIKEQKKNIRATISAKKKELSIETKLLLSVKVFEYVEQLEQFKKANTVLLYHGLKDEVQTEFFIKKWCETKRIILPVVDGEDLLLKEYIPQKIGVGYQTILEPQQTETVSATEIEFAVVPGVAFDAQNNRLGRGKGFYDRFLSAVTAMTIGVCFEVQIVDKIPTESFDKPMNMVITENGEKLS